MRALDRFSCDYPVELVQFCAHEFLAGFPFRGTELVYSDPPHLQATRRSDRHYCHEYTDSEHAALLERLVGLPCRAMVSGHFSALFDGILSHWRRVAMRVTIRAQVCTEVVRFCFTPDRMHWAGQAGRYSTDRRRIKRKAAGWAEGWRKMPPGERLAVVSAIMAVEAG